ncbi:Imm1 family immunity protein [Actinopolyspora mzabensis]|uniref:Imm1 family immunity protein n=1 Tax=Actinopolyspora mzabensis TaxID=995066 RepID=UPI0015A123C4
MRITRNSDVEPQVDLLTDGGTPSYFPRSAALPLGDIRKALVEFVSTGKRPAGVDWACFDRL